MKRGQSEYEMARFQRRIDENIRAHERVAQRYAQDHGEIYNATEQARLRAALAKALSFVRPTSPSPRALDYGCGAGNLTAHLLELGCTTVSADVTAAFLRLVESRYGATGRCTTALLNGENLSQFPSSSFDVVAVYSVLHHIPDYLSAVDEMARVVRPGGVLFIDHEMAPCAWSPSSEYQQFEQLRTPPRRLRHRLSNLLRPSWYLLRARLLANPRYQPEGDIHVWPDDHIEWDRIATLVGARGFEIVEQEDYLLYRRDCPIEVYERFRERCADLRLFIARKRAESS